MIDYYETKSQPITRKMVWQAYQKVKSNKGSFGVDRMDWVALDRDLNLHLYKLWNDPLIMGDEFCRYEDWER
jgi:RNA-directed DNA polymerase